MKKSKILKKLLNNTTITNKSVFVISISGGKDSKATLIVSLPELLKYVNPTQIKVIFCDTGWEKDETMEEIESIRIRLLEFGVELLILSNPTYPNGMTDLIISKKMFPTRMTKMCTDLLKMVPAIDYYKSYKDWGFEIYHPIADWTETDVYSLLDETWGIPKSYFNGNNRVGCDECFQASLKSISLMSEEKIVKMEAVENEISKHYIDKVPTFFFKKNKKFPNGFAPVREIVNYSKEKYNFNYYTFHTRALKYMSEKVGQKTLRYKFIQSGYLPDKTNFSKYVNGKLAVPQFMQFDVEVLTTKILTAKERNNLLKFEKLEEILKEDNELICDCESYNRL